jgi:hypothetical protein
MWCKFGNAPPQNLGPTQPLYLTERSHPPKVGRVEQDQQTQLRQSHKNQNYEPAALEALTWQLSTENGSSGFHERLKYLPAGFAVARAV